MKNTIKTLVAILALLLCSSSYAQNVSIPGTVFLQALIGAGIDQNSDGKIQYFEAEAIDSLDVSGNRIVNITGIEAFINLKYLN